MWCSVTASYRVGRQRLALWKLVDSEPAMERMKQRLANGIIIRGVCRQCGGDCTSGALASCPTCGGAVVAMAQPPVGSWAVAPMLHPRHYTWFVFLSALDLMFTWVLILLGGAEVNPIADAVLQHGGLPGLVVFKFALVMLIVVLCEWATRRSPRTGFKLAEWSVAITAIPVVVSATLLWSAV